MITTEKKKIIRLLYNNLNKIGRSMLAASVLVQNLIDEEYCYYQHKKNCDINVKAGNRLNFTNILRDIRFKTIKMIHIGSLKYI